MAPARSEPGDELVVEAQLAGEARDELGHGLVVQRPQGHSQRDDLRRECPGEGADGGRIRVGAHARCDQHRSRADPSSDLGEHAPGSAVEVLGVVDAQAQALAYGVRVTCCGTNPQ